MIVMTNKQAAEIQELLLCMWETWDVRDEAKKQLGATSQDYIDWVLDIKTALNNLGGNDVLESYRASQKSQNGAGFTPAA